MAAHSEVFMPSAGTGWPQPHAQLAGNASLSGLFGTSAARNVDPAALVRAVDLVLAVCQRPGKLVLMDLAAGRALTHVDARHG